LPDFLVIGIKKGGTSFLYHLLSQHPCVEPAAFKDLHYFDFLFEEGVEWYRRCFPVPRRKDGRRTITGEGTPYLDWPSAPEKVAEVVPQVRLIDLLRDPVDRAYSEYQMVARKGREPRTFEEVVEAERKAWPRAEVVQAAEREDHGGLVSADSEFLHRSVYVEHLLRWSKKRILTESRGRRRDPEDIRSDDPRMPEKEGSVGVKGRVTVVTARKHADLAKHRGRRANG